MIKPAWKRILWLSAILPFVHLCMCVLEVLNRDPNRWQWFIPFMVDFPASIFIMQVANALPSQWIFVVFSTLGGLWWFAISFVLALLVRFVWRVSSRLWGMVGRTRPH